MASRTSSYRSAQQESLADPVRAMHYLNGVLQDYPEGFLKALRKVAQARQMTKVAQVSGVKREALYRVLSETGNPTFDTLVSVLGAVGLNVQLTTKEPMVPEVRPIGKIQVNTSTTVSTQTPFRTTLIPSQPTVQSYGRRATNQQALKKLRARRSGLTNATPLVSGCIVPVTCEVSHA